MNPENQFDLFATGPVVANTDQPAPTPEPTIKKWWEGRITLVIRDGIPGVNCDSGFFPDGWKPILFPVAEPEGGVIHTWTGKGRAPKWAAKWAEARGIRVHRDDIVPALRAEMLEVLV